MNILLIEDDDVTIFLNRKIILDVLPTCNLTVAKSGNEGLAAITNMLTNNQTYQLILVDGCMPDMDGWEFMDEMMTPKFEKQNTAAFFLLTSSLIDDDFIKAKNKPIIKKFYPKPLDKIKFTEMLNTISSKATH